MTYIMKDGDTSYKIGKTEDIGTRLKALRTGNSRIVPVAVRIGDIEDKLHNQFEKRRIRNEFFSFSDAEIEEIIRRYHFVKVDTDMENGEIDLTHIPSRSEKRILPGIVPD